MDEIDLGQYRGMVYRFLLFLLRDPGASDDLSQETFSVALSRGPEPEKGSDYGAWLRSIARNLARNYVRKVRNSPLLVGESMLDLAERRFVEAGADRDGAWDARRRALGACMERLSEDNQGLLRDRYELARKVKQIAAGLGVEPNSVSKRLERIRESLRKCIEETLRGGSDG